MQLKIKNKSGFDLPDDGQASPPTQTRRTATPHAGRAILRNRPEGQLANRPDENPGNTIRSTGKFGFFATFVENCTNDEFQENHDTAPRAPRGGSGAQNLDQDPHDARRGDYDRPHVVPVAFHREQRRGVRHAARDGRSLRLGETGAEPLPAGDDRSAGILSPLSGQTENTRRRTGGTHADSGRSLRPESAHSTV